MVRLRWPFGYSRFTRLKRVRWILVFLIMLVVMSNLWLFKALLTLNISANNVSTLMQYMLFESHINHMVSRNVSKQQLSYNLRLYLDHNSNSNHSNEKDLPAISVLEEVAISRLNCIIKSTRVLEDSMRTTNGKSTLPVQCVRLKKEATEPPLKVGYPSRNFNTICADNVLINQPDYVTLGYIKDNINLAIGMATVARSKSSYLSETLKDLFSKATSDELKDVAVIVFLADIDGNKKTIKDELKTSFASELESGNLMVIEAPNNFYPPLTDLKRNFNDDPKRVYWRSKQCIDFSFIFSFAHNISKFYLHLEDDVTTKKGYLSKIKEASSKMADKYFSVEFSSLGFIAKMFHSKHLLDLASFHFYYHEEMPVDMLQPIYQTLISPNIRVPVPYYPSLFQHKGKTSSLKGKKQLTLDPYYDSSRTFMFHQVEGAFAFTNIPSQAIHGPQNALKPAGMFWSKRPARAEDHYTIVLYKPRIVDYLLIATGNSQHPTDTAVGAKLVYSPTPGSISRKTATCGGNRYKELGAFETPVFAKNLTGLGDIGCIRIVFPRANLRPNWLLISEVQLAYPGQYVSYGDINNMGSGGGGISQLSFAIRKKYEQFIERGGKYV